MRRECIIPGKDCAILEMSMKSWLIDGIEDNELDKFMDEVCEYLKKCRCQDCSDLKNKRIEEVVKMIDKLLNSRRKN